MNSPKRLRAPVEDDSAKEDDTLAWRDDGGGNELEGVYRWRDRLVDGRKEDWGGRKEDLGGWGRRAPSGAGEGEGEG